MSTQFAPRPATDGKGVDANKHVVHGESLAARAPGPQAPGPARNQGLNGSAPTVAPGANKTNGTEDAGGNDEATRAAAAKAKAAAQPHGPAKSAWLYDFCIFFFTIIFNIFFRQIQTRGTHKIPTHGPVIFVGAPHSNQFVDPFMIMINSFHGARRRVSFLIAQVSYNLTFIGRLARAMQAIPVGRSQDTLRRARGRIYREQADPLTIFGEGTVFTEDAKVKNYINIPGSGDLAEVAEIKSDTELVLVHDFKAQKPKSALAKGSTPFRVADHIDNSQMFKSVFDFLAGGGCIGIFPEGGSHDRTEMLPLKAGVAVMALGTIAKYGDCDVSIVPVGLNYFHPNKFRSRAVVHFGDPVKVDPKLVAEYQEGGETRKNAVGTMLSQIADGLGTVTVNVEDYETLMLVQASQRLYRPSRNIPLPLSLEFTRRFVQGYHAFKDDPRIQTLRKRILAYNRELHVMGLRDHQVPTARGSKLRILRRFLYRLARALLIALLCVPGVTLFAPVFIATKIVSRRKAAAALRKSNVKVHATDVIATWKILVALWLTPTLYVIYSGLATYYVFSYRHWLEPTWFTVSSVFWAVTAVLAFVSWTALKMGEVGVDIFGSLWPLVLALSPSHSDALAQLRELRQELVYEVTGLVNELGPQVFPDIGERIREHKVEFRDPEHDPRTDLHGVRRNFDLSEVPIFSTAPVSEAESRASRLGDADSDADSSDFPASRETRATRARSVAEVDTASGTELNKEITRRIKKAMQEHDG